MDPSPKRIGRYELVAQLGAGGMGEVHLAHARGAARVRKTVVLKTLRKEQMDDDAARARFVEEARVAISLAHPHVVPVFEFGEHEGTYFLVMEWVRGGELARIGGVDRPPLGWAATALLGSQLCDALAYVHARKDRRGSMLVHGDVTPKNVLLSRDGHALLTDFGLARFAPRGRAGTRRYLAPEQARGEPSDGRADLYALALVLCEAVTGQPAYDRDPDRAQKQARVGLVPALDDADAHLASVLRRALAPSRDARFSDATAMREAFEALLDREPRARATGRAELIARSAERAGSEDSALSRLEGRADRSAVATREATRAPRTRRAALLVMAMLLAAGVTAVGARVLYRPQEITGEHVEPLRIVQPVPSSPTPMTAPPTPRTTAPFTTSPKPASGRHRGVVVAPIVAPVVAPAYVDLNAAPWAHVRIDGVERGETPLLGVALPPGPHLIELINEPLGARRELRLDLHSGEHVQRLENLTRSGP